MLQEYLALLARYVKDPDGRARLFEAYRQVVEAEPGPVAADDRGTTWGSEASIDGRRTQQGAAGGVHRYTDEAPLGKGGMGEVRRVRDGALHRSVAMKLLARELAGRREAEEAFLSEAQATAQLQHPGVVPVHEVGRIGDRPYFTMQIVLGRTLTEAMDATHDESSGALAPRRLIAVFHAVCETVAYAHAKGVVHRDLKPDNVMIGPFGEVRVLDWGLARVTRGLSEVRTARSTGSRETRMGAVAGTPIYMSPEQARGEVDRIDARSDVYGLGAMLYELLTGNPPYRGRTADEVLDAVRAGPPPPPIPVFPELGELAAICRRAMARDPADRYPDAAALAAEVGAWLDGAGRRERASKVVSEATRAASAAAMLRSDAADLEQAAARALAGVREHDPEERKRPGWDLQDRAAELRLHAELREEASLQALQASLTHAPELPEAHRALARRFRASQEEAEARRDTLSARRAELRLRAHLDALPPGDPDRKAHAAWLEGTGAVTLVTDVDGAEVTLHRFVERHRRLVVEPVRGFGRTPLVRVPLERGSWLLRIEAPGRVAVDYPVHLGRGQHWDGAPPGAREPFPIRLPRPGELGPDDRYVPAGWFLSGGDPREGHPPTPRWVDPFVIRRVPVTNREYVAWLDALVADGREEEALRHAPQLQGGVQVLSRDADGRFLLGVDLDGDPLLPDHPVVNVDRRDAAAFAAAEAGRTGSAWRLAGQFEREKAGRGVDGREYPWGDHFDAAWTWVRPSQAGRPLPTTVGLRPVDVSVYGVHDVGGGAEDWCLDPFDTADPGPRPALPDPGEDLLGREFACRGGSWASQYRMTRCANRGRRMGSLRAAYLSFRLARSFR